MHNIFRRLPLAVAISLALPALALAQEATLGRVVVTAPVTEAPLTVTTDPRAPRQPLPAHDGADMLKSIPGFSVIRKGGTDGDPVFRGMSGSRLGILLDGQEIHGGCGGRMDPPTAYIYPESYDRVTVLKGPQQVLYVPGSSAGVVLFERESRRMTEPGWSAQLILADGFIAGFDAKYQFRTWRPITAIHAAAALSPWARRCSTSSLRAGSASISWWVTKISPMALSLRRTKACSSPLTMANASRSFCRSWAHDSPRKG